jgi:hypothetical protein
MYQTQTDQRAKTKAIEQLAQWPRWVMWRNVERGGKPTKVPKVAKPTGTAEDASATDSATWRDFLTAKRCLTERPGWYHGIGIVLGDLSDGWHLCGVDLDSCISRGTDGEPVIASWAHSILDVLRSTYVEVSPSGSGLKAFFRVAANDAAEARSMFGIINSAWGCKRCVGGDGADHGPAFELYLGPGRYFALTGKRWSDAADEIASFDLDALERLAAVTPKPRVDASVRGLPTPHTAPRSDGRDTSRSARAFSLAIRAHRRGESYDQYLEAVRIDPETAAWYAEKGVAYKGRELRRAWERARNLSDHKPELVVQRANRPASVLALRDLLAECAAELYDRDRQLVTLKRDANGQLFTKLMTVSNIVMLTQEHCQPVRYDKDNVKYDTDLPDNVAKMYLELSEWNVRPLAGITTTPLIRADGTILSSSGYDDEAQFFVDAVPRVTVPERPTDDQAKAALMLLREAFATFPFADAELTRQGDLDRVMLSKPPGLYESAFLTALLTAVARPSLWLAPGVVITAPQTSGSGAGKGLLLNGIAMIATGQRSEPFTSGHGVEELDKRITAELLSGRPFLQLDNVNATSLRSETLASALSERPIRIRPLGVSRSERVNAAPFVGLTGNGLTVSEDQCRRLLQVRIDPRMEDPEKRPFAAGFVDQIKARRGEMLTACLTILRWGRLEARRITPGMPTGSFETWSEWVRDPLLALGCRDAVEGMQLAKQDDPRRIKVAALFDAWWEHHRNDPIKLSELHDDVRKLIDPTGRRAPQYVESEVSRLAGTRHAGFLLTRHKREAQRWSVARYTLEQQNVSLAQEDRHRSDSDPDRSTVLPSPSTGENDSSDENRMVGRASLDVRAVPPNEPHKHRTGAAILEQWLDESFLRQRKAQVSRRVAAALAWKPSQR